MRTENLLSADQIRCLQITNYADQINWLIKLHVYLEKRLKKISKKKIKKLHKLSGNSVMKDSVSTRFQDHLDIFTFLNDFSVHCDNFSPDIVNAANSVIIFLFMFFSFKPTTPIPT